MINPLFHSDVIFARQKLCKPIRKRWEGERGGDRGKERGKGTREEEKERSSNGGRNMQEEAALKEW